MTSAASIIAEEASPKEGVVVEEEEVEVEAEEAAEASPKEAVVVEAEEVEAEEVEGVVVEAEEASPKEAVVVEAEAEEAAEEESWRRWRSQRRLSRQPWRTIRRRRYN